VNACCKSPWDYWTSFYVGLIYPLYADLAHSKWLLEMKDACEPMFLSWFIALGPFLLLAARSRR